MRRQSKKQAQPATDPKVKGAILALIREALFGIEAGAISGVDWDAVLQECRKQHLVTLLHDGAAKQEMPADARKRWKEESDRMLLYNINSQRWHTRVQKELDAAGIPSVILKGLSSAYYYPKPILRGAGDVDVLVRKEDMDAGGRVLESMGLARAKNAELNEAHIAYYKKGANIELHWQMNGLPPGEPGDPVRAALAGMIRDAVPYTCESGTCRIPSVWHHAMVLVIHTARHLMGSGTSVRHLCDWAAFVARVGEEEFESRLREPMKELGLWNLAQIFTDICSRHLGLAPQRWAGVTDADYADELLEEFFTSGYFGRKNPARVYDHFWFLNAYTRDVTSGLKFRNFMRRMNVGAHRAMPVTKRVPILLPIGWVYLVGRYIFRVKTGRRPIVRISDIEAARRRSELYSAMRLFEPEEKG